MLKVHVRHVAIALFLLFLVIGLGAAALFWLGGGNYSFFETAYFAVITVASVGYSELPQMERLPVARLITVVMIVCGLATIAFFQSTLTTLLIEGYIGKAFRSRFMKKKISALSGHFVVAGCGRTGRYVVEELVATRLPFVVVDQDEAKLLHLAGEVGQELLCVVGDATDDHVLLAAGVERASGVIAALPSDPDNLFITLSARALNPGARIVSKVVEIENEPKIFRAGADSVVSPHRIGGLRLVSQLVRPRVTEFLDRMLRVTKNLRFDEVVVPASSEYANKVLREIPIRQETKLLVIALHLPGDNYVYNPGPDAEVAAGASLIVMGEPDDVAKLRTLFGASASSSWTAADSLG
ncbi:MAG: potassium channel protein [Polyangiaceae bacterium]|nr:potassium channel protein [Polyangiaceae bacterium]